MAGKGLKGDRFFGKSARDEGQVTFFSIEVFEVFLATLDLKDTTLEGLRRNIVIAGVPLKDLMDVEFEIDGGRFAGSGHAAPCSWMACAYGPGANKILRGRGGMRARVLVGGTIKRGPGLLHSPHPLDPSASAQPVREMKLP